MRPSHFSSSIQVTTSGCSQQYIRSEHFDISFGTMAWLDSELVMLNILSYDINCLSTSHRVIDPEPRHLFRHYPLDYQHASRIMGLKGLKGLCMHFILNTTGHHTPTQSTHNPAGTEHWGAEGIALGNSNPFCPTVAAWMNWHEWVCHCPTIECLELHL